MITLSAHSFDLRFQVRDTLIHVRVAPRSLLSELSFKLLKLFLKRVALLLETLDFASASLKLVRDGLGKGVLDFTLLTLLLLFAFKRIQLLASLSDFKPELCFRLRRRALESLIELLYRRFVTFRNFF